MDDTGGDEECWEYLDPKAVKWGPFKSSQMALWHEHKMLPEELQVRHCPDMPFLPIKELFPPPRPPFRSRPRPGGLSAGSGKCQCTWQYRDKRGQLQGPFNSAQMALWYEHQMLPPDLQLRRSTDASFATIHEYFPPPLVPFKSQPKDPPATALGGRQATDALRHDLAEIGIQLGHSQEQLRARPKAASAKSQPKAAALQSPPCPKTGYEPAPLVPQPVAKQAGKAKGQGPKGTEVPGQTGRGGGKGANNHGPDGVADGSSEPLPGGSGGGKGKGRGKNNKQQPQQQQQQPGQQQGAGWNWFEQQGWVGGGGAGSAGSEAWWQDQSWWSGWGEGWDQDRQKGADWKGDGNGNGGPIGASPQPKDKGEKNSGVQAVFGSLRWGPHMEASDLFPGSVLRKVLDEGIVWEERWTSPLAVRFSQGKIHPFFHERGPICEVMLQIRSREDTEGVTGEPIRRIEPPFPPIRLLHLKQQGVLVTLDNRRLYALQRFALKEWPTLCLVKVLCVDELTPTRLRAENRKFTNRICGLQLEVESRSNAFDTFSWVTEAARMEAPRFSRPISLRAIDKAMSLLPVLVVHTILCSRNRSLLQSRWPVLDYLARQLPDPGNRCFPSKRLLMLHVLELARPGQSNLPCPPLCVGYKTETVVSLSKGRSCVTSKLSLQKPLTLLKSPSPLSPVQRQVLLALLPLVCVPYAKRALRGHTQRWVVAFLLAWGKVSMCNLRFPEGP